MTPLGIEPITLHLVAQCLNQPCDCVPQNTEVTSIFILTRRVSFEHLVCFFQSV